MSAPVRVLLIAPALSVVGGQSVQADRHLRYLVNRPEVAVTLLPLGAELSGVLGRLRFLRTILRSFVYWAKLLKAIRHTDVVHAFTAGAWSFNIVTLPAFAAARLFGKKIILHYHDGRAKSHLSKSPMAVSILKSVDALVVPSPFLQQVFQPLGIRSQAICNIADSADAIYRRRDRLRPIVVHNRMMERHYNIPCTLRTFAIVKQRYPDAVLLIAGDGPERASLEALATHLELRNVHFLGVVEMGDMPRFLDGADIYITTTDADNMPLSLLECYAAGLPVVATRAGGIPWIAIDDETALLVDRDDHEAAAAAICRFLQDPALADRIATRARTQSQERYSGNAIAAEWVDLYLAVATGKARSSRVGADQQEPNRMRAGASTR